MGDNKQRGLNDDTSGHHQAPYLNLHELQFLEGYY